jgi:putative endonuclease
MSTQHKLGNAAEKLAVDYLLILGFTILHRNWRHSRFENDIIAIKQEVLHFIEVKSLSNDQVIYPEQHVTTRKFQSLNKAASSFLSQHKIYGQVQFDVLSVTINKEGPVSVD